MAKKSRRKNPPALTREDALMRAFDPLDTRFGDHECKLLGITMERGWRYRLLIEHDQVDAYIAKCETILDQERGGWRYKLITRDLQRLRAFLETGEVPEYQP